MFDCFIGVGYTGAQTAATRLKGLQVYAAEPGMSRPRRWDNPLRSAEGVPLPWNRREVAERLRDEARRGTRFLAGIDHGFSLPIAHFGRQRLEAWPAFLSHFVTHWPTHQERVSVDAVRRGLLRQQNLSWLPAPAADGSGGCLRLTERWTVSARSILLFDAQGSAAKAAHAGIPWLKWLRDEVGERLHFWPFDGWHVPAGKSVIAEVHPPVFRRRYAGEQREEPAQGAYATARWMADMAARDALAACFEPPLTAMERDVASLEGWMLGVR